MPIHEALKLALLTPSLLALGCASGDPDATMEPISTSQEAVVSTNRLSMNRLSMNRLSLNGLSAARISPNGLTMTQTPLLSDESGRELLRYVTRCALPAGKKLTATVASTTYVFEGAIGLAPWWLYGSIGSSEQRWVSACLLAHVNGYGVEVPISLRGNHPALATDTAERSLFVEQEVSFYGNVFIHPSEDGDYNDDYSYGYGYGYDCDADDDDNNQLQAPAPAQMYSCGGQNLRLKCGADAAQFNASRSCAQNPDCALKFTGVCHDSTSASAHACEIVDASGYRKCHATAQSSFGWWSTASSYPEVITVYLKTEDLGTFYPGCALP